MHHDSWAQSLSSMRWCQILQLQKEDFFNPSGNSQSRMNTLARTTIVPFVTLTKATPYKKNQNLENQKQNNFKRNWNLELLKIGQKGIKFRFSFLLRKRNKIPIPNSSKRNEFQEFVPFGIRSCPPLDTQYEKQILPYYQK